ncbi:MAG: hypothetical protein D6797_02190 [Bdellovibrio sp.]|nr:MAG: hypothetical protein D6797_02190 [Bdellovibrio sp.]
MKKIIVLLLIILIPSSFALITTVNEDPRIDWYEVSDDDLAVCLAWGGTENTITSTTKGEVSGPDFLTELTIAVQASKTPKPNGQSLYEVAWYVQPFEGTVDYNVSLVSENSSLLIASASSVAQAGSSGYFANYSATNYTTITLKHSLGEISNIPIVVRE